jgi:hypothetical protein
LWHAVKKGQDPWKGRYLLEIIRYEKQQGKKRKGSEISLWSVQDLDITETNVFSYNFYLSKLGTMYKKTIERIQIRRKFSREKYI